MIRQIELKDRNFYIELAEKFYQTDGVMHTIPNSHFEITFDTLLKDKTYGDIFVYEENEKIVGYVLLAKTFSQEAGGIAIWVEELYVLSEYEGKGIGSALFEYVLKNYQAARFRLEVEPENKKATAIYKKRGFEFIEYQQMIKELKYKKV